MTKYGSTDPSVYQLRDLNRRMSRLEKKVDNLILKSGRRAATVATKLRNIRAALGSSANAADLEEE